MFFSRLSEKKAQIGYTYEDSTVTEPDEEAEKGREKSLFYFWMNHSF